MTWGEFKARVEEQGVKDEDEIRYIDVGGLLAGAEVAFDEDRESDERRCFSVQD